MLPPMVFDFIDGGAEDETTVSGNEAAFARWWFRPQLLEDVTTRRISTELFGTEFASPVFLGPAGLAGLAWPHGEAEAAAAASGAGVPFVVSTASSCSIEEVRAAAGGPLWLQLYLWRDREVTGGLVERAARAGYTALCLTVDVPLSGSRERDLRNGMTIPPRIGVKNAAGVLSRPGWMLRSARAPVTFANVSEGRRGRTVALGKFVNSQLNPSANWADLRWLRELWKGTLVVKGVLDAHAAARLVDEGVDGVVVSNHGGRQLDGALPSLVALPEVVEAVGGRVPVLIDGGVRRGTDVVKAVALGASACLIGRPYLWGLAVGGRAGASRVLELFAGEVDRTLALLGVPDLASVRGRASELLVEDRCRR
ncbi:MAG TPA: alpha-hydroxy acid oxidase [Gaiellaceae bacterium]|nr:alpha-hydroxy acid oxidase [Gaiellaceae bacterium]